MHIRCADSFSVSVAQKTVGYEKGSLAFSPALLGAIDAVDKSLGQVVSALKAKSLLDDTLIIVASKHGQAPIDPSKYSKINKQLVTNATKVDVVFQTVIAEPDEPNRNTC